MMKASKLEFRLRYWIHTVVYVLGFVSPWTYVHRSNELRVEGAGSHVWGALGTWLTHTVFGPTQIVAASNTILIAAILFACAGAWLRTWGTAYLGAGVMQSGEMHAGAEGHPGVLRDGPYRHLRNPLYVGTFLHSVAVTMLMTPSGAIFTLVAMAVIQARLIGGEEAYLTGRLGEAYRAYQAKVPAVVPSLRARVAGTDAVPRWGQAFVAEIYMWGVAGSFACAGWWYSSVLLLKCVIVSFGVSLVVRALVGTVGKDHHR